MVMKRSAMIKNVSMSIRRSFGRYIAIVAIIALGAGLFLGLLMTKTDMVATGQAFMDRQNMFDFRVLNDYGWSKEQLQAISALDGVEDAEGMVSLDLIARIQGREEDSVYRFHSIPERINQVELRGGRMPEKDNECLADGFQGGEALLGKTITIAENNDEDSLDAVRFKTFTIVGCVATPLYMDLNRGTTSVGSGSLANYFYIPAGAFDVDYYTEIDITLPEKYPIYSERYEQALDAAEDALEPQLTPLVHQRFLDVKQDAEEAYADGRQEYLDGRKELWDAVLEAEDELHKGWQDLRDGEKELAANKKKLEDSEIELKVGQITLSEKKRQMEMAWDVFESERDAALGEIDAQWAQLEAEEAKLRPAYEEANAALGQINAELETVNAEISSLSGQISEIDAQMDSIMENPDYLLDPELLAQLADLAAERAELSARMMECNARKAELESRKMEHQVVVRAYEAIGAGFEAVEKEAMMLEAAEQVLVEAQQQLDAGQRKLNSGRAQLSAGWEKFREGEKELADGWKEYEDGKLKAQQEIAEGMQELRDAAAELSQAREDIDSMEESELYLLDRTSNAGYNNLDSSSDIVAGVSRVMPVFFLLVASLVCITTMTRMIDEERTQIGTLKALGYSNAAIIGKYLVYSGSGAVLGCGLGVLAGSTIFPQILWQAYCIMLYIQPNVVLTIHWPLCLAVAALYTAVMLCVTWYSVHKTLEEQPAELIRPKAPDAGKKILLEYFWFWKKIPFLDKVSIRNIFRYRQRLAMMLVGIGGCTALLLTGFGLRDSIVNVVDYQFEEVTNYDISVYFREGLTEEEQADFREAVEDSTRQSMFYHQSSVDLLYEEKLKSLYMLSGSDRLQSFIKLHDGAEVLSMPGENEVLLSVGAAKALGIHEGDSVQLRNADLEILELTVSGIYDNHVNNYAIVSPQTIEKQWGSPPALQMAFLNVDENTDIHILGAEITELDNVMNIAVSEDIAESVGSMMEALDLVVWVIVFCAGLLAVTVLYNLTNININERIREIATIKVLGFNARETAAYVFKENMTLTVAGALLGLPLGMLLLTFVMSQIKIDLVWFKALVEPISYLWSIALTLLSAIAVNFIFYFKLQKINMAEALKSVE